MKNIFKKFVTVALIACLVLTTACNEKQNNQSGDEGEPQVTYTLSQTEAQLTEEQTLQLEVSANPAQEQMNVEWATSNEEVATVENGLVTAIKAGSANVTATVDGNVLTCAITVEAKPIVYQYALNFNSFSIEEEQTKQLIVAVDPEKEIEVEWTSNAQDVATVDATGLVTAVAPGTAQITATVDGNQLVCEVEVTAKPIVYEYTLSSSAIELTLGAEADLTVTVAPEKAFVANYTSENEGVAMVDANGKIKAVGVGETKIMVEVDDKTLYCSINVTSPVVATALRTDGEGMNVDMDTVGGELDTLYWEHYQGDSIDCMLNAEDLVTSNNIETYTNGFYDFKVGFGWNNGSNITQWGGGNHNGRHTTPGQACTIEATLKVNENVKKVLVYVGAWRATNTTALYYNGVQIAAAEPFTAGDASLGYQIAFDINASEEVNLTLKTTASDVGENGNVSMVAIIMLGKAQNTATTSLSVTKTALTDKANVINLTEKGTTDWFYLNYEHQTDEMANGTAIDTSSLKVEGNGFGWDYLSQFVWSNGTTNVNNLVDNDIGDNAVGTNNFKYGAYVLINVKVTAQTKNVVYYVSGWSSTYNARIIDAKGNTLYHEQIAENNGGTQAFALDFAVNATADDTLTFIVYRPSGANCGIAAVAVN
ncbi:MAG: Ig-like domain-containing protein [Clostridia bacterium]|nr:Ig-like domain-containing protein [Clostridia bacterium]